MYRPNRIGIAAIHTPDQSQSSADWTPNTQDNWAPGWLGNVINSAPVADFGRTALTWVGSEAIAANKRIAIGQQFTITQPLNANQVGMELTGSLTADLPADALVVPVMYRLVAAGGAVFAPVTSDDFATVLGQAQLPTGNAYKHNRYQTPLVVYDNTPTRLPGTYFHGWAIYGTATGYTLTTFYAECAIRQFNDLQEQRPRDPLR